MDATHAHMFFEYEKLGLPIMVIIEGGVGVSCGFAKSKIFGHLDLIKVCVSYGLPYTQTDLLPKMISK